MHLSTPTATSHAEAARPFDDDFYDVPAQRPAIGIGVDQVGVTGQKISITTADALFGGPTDLLCDASAEVSLRADQRGIHMSRIERALQSAPAGSSLPTAALAIANEIRDLQLQDTAQVRLDATVPVRTRTRITGLSSPDTVEVSAFAIAGAAAVAGIALSANNITACPCMQSYALTELIDELGLSPKDGRRLLGRVPIATHSQKGRVRLEVRAPQADRLPDYQTLYRVLTETTALTQELLKRPDEYDLVKRVHLNPQFVEDVARAVAAGIARALADDGADLDGIHLDAFAESYESIHGHDINARIRTEAISLTTA